VEQPHLVDSSNTEVFEAILALTKQAFAYMDGRIDPPSSVHRLSVDALAAPGHEVWAIGYPPKASIVMTPRSDVLYVGKLAVVEAERGRGLARLLIDHAEVRAGELGLVWLELQTRIELTENHRAFESMGFVETERTAHPGYGQLTSLTLRRSVTPRRDHPPKQS